MHNLLNFYEIIHKQVNIAFLSSGKGKYFSAHMFISIITGSKSIPFLVSLYNTLHLSEPFTDVSGNEKAIQEVAKHYRRIYKGVLMINRGFNKNTAKKVLSDGHDDLVSFGVPYIANPDLVERFKADAALSTPDQATFYTPGEKGYTDYPFMNNN